MAGDSLGIIIYEMLAGAAPFHAKAAMAFMRQHMVAEPPPLRSRVPEVSKELGELVHCMLAKEPQARPDMAQVVEQLRKIQSPARYRDTLLVPEPRRGRAVAWWLVGATLAVLTLAGALWVAWGRLFPSLPTGPGATPTPTPAIATPTPKLSPIPPLLLRPSPGPRADLGTPRLTAPPPVPMPADAASLDGPLDGGAPPDGETAVPADLAAPARAEHEPSPAPPPEPVEPPPPRPVVHPVKHPPSKPPARPETRHHGGKRGKRTHSH